MGCASGNAAVPGGGGRRRRRKRRRRRRLMGYASGNRKFRSTRWSELVAAVSPFVTSYDMTIRREIS